MTLETYVRAASSRNLSWSDHSTNDIDWLTAAALCTGQEAKLPGALARLMANKPDSFWPVVEILESAYTKKRRLSRDGRREIESAVLWWMNPACKTCKGLGSPKHDDAPHLKAVLCPTCLGTGLTEHEHATRPYADSLRRLEEAKIQCQSKLSRRVGDEVPA